MSEFVRQYVTVAVVAIVVSLLGAAVAAAGQVLRPASRSRRDPEPAPAPLAGGAAAPLDAAGRSERPRAVGPRRPSGLVLAAVLCGTGLLLAPWAVGAGLLSGGELAVGLVAAAAVGAGLLAATR